MLRTALALAALISSAGAAFAAEAKDAYGDPLPPGATARFGSLRFLQRGRIYALLAAADGKAVLSGGDNREVAVWDTEGRQQGRLDTANRVPLSISASPGGKTVAVGCEDGVIRLYGLGEPKPAAELKGHRGRVFALAFSRDGKRLVSGGQDKTVRIWDPAKGEQLQEMRGHDGDVSGVAFAPDGKTVFSGSRDRTARIWDVSGGRELVKVDGHREEVSAVAVSGDGSLLAVAGRHRHVTLWDARTGKEAGRLGGARDGLRYLAVSPDGRKLAGGGSRGFVEIWDFADGAKPTNTPLRGVPAFSPDGKRLLAGGAGGQIASAEVASGKLMDGRGHVGPVSAIACLADGGKLLTVGDDGALRAWEGRSGKQLRCTDGLSGPFALSPDGRLLACSAGEGAISVLDAGEGTVRIKLAGKWGAEPYGTMAFSPGGASLAVGMRGRVAILSPGNGQVVAELDWHRDMPSCLAFSPDGTLLAAGGRDRHLRLWRPPERKPARDFEGLNRGVRALAFSPTGPFLASSGWERECRIWNLKDGGEGQRCGGREGLAMAYSPDGKALAVASWDGRVEVFDGKSEKPVLTVSGHYASVTCLAFSKDSRTLYTGSWDSTALAWDLAECQRLAGEHEKRPPHEHPPREKPPREQPPKEQPKEDPEPL